jgi:hypothetical protein
MIQSTLFLDSKVRIAYLENEGTSSLKEALLKTFTTRVSKLT